MYEPYDWFVIDHWDAGLFGLGGLILGPLLIVIRKVIGFIWHHVTMITHIMGDGLPDAPDSFAAICGQFTTTFHYVSPVAAYIPWTQLGVAIGITISGFIIGVLIKVAMKVISVFTGGGGSSA